MRRRLFSFFSALSLLVCLAVCGVWVRSYWRAYVVLSWGESVADRRAVRSERGSLSVFALPQANDRREYRVRVSAEREDDILWEVVHRTDRVGPP